jgi:hypothetical protein
MLQLLTRVVASSLCALGCGAADNVKVERSDTDEVSIESTVNTCPVFAFYLVLPKEILPNEVAVVSAQATDIDSDDAKLEYSWSATSGEFTDAQQSPTSYTCGDSGPQVLHVTTLDPDGCEAALDLDVTCLAP